VLAGHHTILLRGLLRTGWTHSFRSWRAEFPKAGGISGGIGGILSRNNLIVKHEIDRRSVFSFATGSGR
jgi:hypothetical protein